MSPLMAPVACCCWRRNEADGVCHGVPRSVQSARFCKAAVVRGAF